MTAEKINALANLLRECRESGNRLAAIGESPLGLHRAACLYVAFELRRAQ